MLHAAALSDMASGLIPQDARYRQVRSGLHYEPVGSLLQLRGGYSGEHLELSFERQMTRMQALKDKMLAAIKRGDKAAARDLSRELKALKATAERRFRKLQGAGTPALEPASDAPGVAGNSSRDGADGLAVERGRTRVRMVSGSTNTTTAGEAVGAHPEAWTTGMLATYLELLRRMDAEGKRQRAELDAEMRAQVEAAGAREEAVCMDASGRLEADALAHGLAKCRNQSCAFCCEEHHDAELDLSLRHDGIQASLDPPLVFHFVKRGGRGAEGAEGERGGEQGSEDLLVVLPSSHLPLAPSPSKCRPNGTQGLLVRLNHSVFMTVEDRETLALVAQGKEVAQTDVAALEARLPALNAEDEQRRKGRVEWEEHVAEEYRLQQAEDMVWDGEARSLNEGLHLLALREHARDRWYSIRGPHDDRLHMGMGHIACYTRRGEEEVERWGLELQLCHASWQGNLHEVRRLLQAGARVRYHMCFYRRWTPLHFAAAGGWPEVVDELVQAGAEVNATDDGQQHALFAAAAAGGQHLTPIPDHIAAHLPRATPWPTPNNKGHTTQVPTRRGNWSTEGSLAVARRLVAYDIHLWARDHAGMTADQVAAIYDREETRDMLRRLMGKDKPDETGCYARLAREEEDAVKRLKLRRTPGLRRHQRFEKWVAAEWQKRQNMLEGDELACLVSPHQVPLVARKQHEDFERAAAEAKRERVERQELWESSPWAPVLDQVDLDNSDSVWNLDLHNRTMRRMEADAKAGRLVQLADGMLEDRGVHLPPLPGELRDAIDTFVDGIVDQNSD